MRTLLRHRVIHGLTFTGPRYTSRHPIYVEPSECTECINCSELLCYTLVNLQLQVALKFTNETYFWHKERIHKICTKCKMIPCDHCLLGKPTMACHYQRRSVLIAIFNGKGYEALDQSPIRRGAGRIPSQTELKTIQCTISYYQIFRYCPEQRRCQPLKVMHRSIRHFRGQSRFRPSKSKRRMWAVVGGNVCVLRRMQLNEQETEISV